MLRKSAGSEACPRNATVVYAAKDGKDTKVFPAMEWLAAMCSHIPNRGEQMVRYYGYYSNVARGKRKKAESDDLVSCILEPQGNEKAYRKSWARLIQKIYEVDPLVCPKCQGVMRIISFIEDPSVIRDQGRRRKAMTRQTSNTLLLIFKFNHTLTLSTAIRNTPGMNTYSHNVMTNIKTGRDG
jgi:hypothetical protein